MKRETIYQRLRDIGCTVDTSDAMAEVLEPYRDNKVEAFIMWAKDISIDTICELCHISKRDLYKMIKKARISNGSF